MSPFWPHESKISAGGGFIPPLLILTMGVLSSYFLADDYYDKGPLGLPMTLIFGFAATWGMLAFLKMSPKLKTIASLWSIVPWSFGLAGIVYIGFFFVPVEVALSFSILRNKFRLAAGKAIGIAIISRAVSFLALRMSSPMIPYFHR